MVSTAPPVLNGGIFISYIRFLRTAGVWNVYICQLMYNERAGSLFRLSSEDDSQRVLGTSLFLISTIRMTSSTLSRICFKMSAALASWQWQVSLWAAAAAGMSAGH